jgi:AcrR family transcriptional regulator
MARTRAFDDAQVVRAARDVFWERGYAASSLAQLQQATGLSKSSLYETYGSKRGLFGRAAEGYLAEIIDPRLAPVEAVGAARGELVGYFASVATLLRSAPDRVARRGCLLLNSAMELDDLDAGAAALVGGYRARVRAAFRRAIRNSGVDRAVADRRADLLTAGMIGVMVTSRLDPVVAADLADTIAADIRSWKTPVG